MATIKHKDVHKLGDEEMQKKIREIKLELVKARVASGKAGSAKIRNSKRIIAKILTLNKSHKEALKK